MWVKSRGSSPNVLVGQGILRLREPEKRGMSFGCQNIDDSGMRTASRASAPCTPSMASSETRMPGWSGCSAGEKNSLRRVRPGPPDRLRPEGAARSGSGLRRLADLPGRGDSSSLLHSVRAREARAPAVAGGHAGLHPALRLRRGPALPGDVPPGCGQGVPPGLEDGQDAGDVVYAGATPPGRDARPARDRP